jgi:hypothetical protein
MTGTVVVPLTVSKGGLAIPLVGAVGTTGGEVGAVLNPEGGTLIITDAILYIAVISTGAANLNVGIAANANTSDATLISALSAQSTALVGYNGINPAAQSTFPIWTSTQYVTVTGTGDTSGFVGVLHLKYLHV